jgi:hypothetical protein
VAKASEVISICLENRLPLADNVLSPAKFAVPVSLTNIYKQGIFFILQAFFRKMLTVKFSEDRSGSSSRDTTPNSEEDKTTDEDCLVPEVEEETCLEDSTVLPPILLRDIDELKCYSSFFEELKDSPQSSRESSLSDSEDEEDSLSSASKSTRSMSQSEVEALNPIEILKELKIFSKIRCGTDPFKVYTSIASKVISVIPFVKVAYPDMVGAESVQVPEPLYNKDRRVCR